MRECAVCCCVPTSTDAHCSCAHPRHCRQLSDAGSVAVPASAAVAQSPSSKHADASAVYAVDKHLADCLSGAWGDVWTRGQHMQLEAALVAENIWAPLPVVAIAAQSVVQQRKAGRGAAAMAAAANAAAEARCVCVCVCVCVCFCVCVCRWGGRWRLYEIWFLR